MATAVEAMKKEGYVLNGRPETVKDYRAAYKDSAGSRREKGALLQPWLPPRCTGESQPNPA
jgi:hypothetical protein